MRPSKTLLAIPFLLLVASSSVGAGAPSKAQPSDLFLEWLSGWGTESPLGAEAMRYGLDPETGEWGYPGRAAMQRAATLLTSLRPGQDGDADLARVIQLPDGSTVAYLDGRSMEFSVVHVGPDGHLHFDCLTNHGTGSVLDPRTARRPPEW
jgi:hypothetical protein